MYEYQVPYSLLDCQEIVKGVNVDQENENEEENGDDPLIKLFKFDLVFNKVLPGCEPTFDNVIAEVDEDSHRQEILACHFKRMLLFNSTNNMVEVDSGLRESAQNVFMRFNPSVIRAKSSTATRVPGFMGRGGVRSNGLAISKQKFRERVKEFVKAVLELHDPESNLAKTLKATGNKIHFLYFSYARQGETVARHSNAVSSSGSEAYFGQTPEFCHLILQHSHIVELKGDSLHLRPTVSDAEMKEIARKASRPVSLKSNDSVAVSHSSSLSAFSSSHKRARETDLSNLQRPKRTFFAV